MSKSAKKTVKKAKQTIEQVKEQLEDANHTLHKVLSSIGEKTICEFLSVRLDEDLQWEKDGIDSAQKFLNEFGGSKEELNFNIAVKKETELTIKQLKAFVKQYDKLKEKRGY